LPKVQKRVGNAFYRRPALFVNGRKNLYLNGLLDNEKLFGHFNGIERAKLRLFYLKQIANCGIVPMD